MLVFIFMKQTAFNYNRWKLIKFYGWMRSEFTHNWSDAAAFLSAVAAGRSLSRALSLFLRLCLFSLCLSHPSLLPSHSLSLPLSCTLSLYPCQSSFLLALPFPSLCFFKFLPHSSALSPPSSQFLPFRSYFPSFLLPLPISYISSLLSLVERFEIFRI